MLVLGASGGVGTMLVSLARSAGATVWGQTGSPEKTAVIEEQGADRAFVAGPDELLGAIDEFRADARVRLARATASWRR